MQQSVPPASIPPTATAPSPQSPPQNPVQPRTPATIGTGILHSNTTSAKSALPPMKPLRPQTPPSHPGAKSVVQSSPLQPVPPTGTAKTEAPDGSFTDDLSSTWQRTKCTACGFLYEGTKMLTVCPRCGNTDPDKFEESD